MMLIAGLTTALGIGALLIAVGYRMFHSGSEPGLSDVTIALPKGARIVSSAVSGDRLLLTLDIGGVTEIRTFDARSFRPVARVKFAVEP